MNFRENLATNWVGDFVPQDLLQDLHLLLWWHIVIAETGINDKGEYVISLSSSKRRTRPAQTPGKLIYPSKVCSSCATYTKIVFSFFLGGAADPPSRSQETTGTKHAKKSQSQCTPSQLVRRKARPSSQKTKVAKELSFGGSPEAIETGANTAGRQTRNPKEETTRQKGQIKQSNSYSPSGENPMDRVLTPLRRNPEGCLDTIFKAVLRDKARQAGVTPGSTFRIETPWSRIEPEEPDTKSENSGEQENSEVIMTVSDSDSAPGSPRNKEQAVTPFQNRSYTSSSSYCFSPTSVTGFQQGIKVSSDLAKLLESDKPAISTWEKQRRDRRRKHLENVQNESYEDSGDNPESFIGQHHPMQQKKRNYQSTSNGNVDKEMENHQDEKTAELYQAGPFEWDDPKLAQAIRKLEVGFKAFAKGEPVRKHISFSGVETSQPDSTEEEARATNGAYGHSSLPQGADKTLSLEERDASNGSDSVLAGDDRLLHDLREELRQEREARKELTDMVQSLKENVSPGAFHGAKKQSEGELAGKTEHVESSRSPLQTLQTDSTSSDEVWICNPDTEENNNNDVTGSAAHTIENTEASYHPYSGYNPSAYSDDWAQQYQAANHHGTDEDEEPVPATIPQPRPAPQMSYSSHWNSSQGDTVVRSYNVETRSTEDVRSSADEILRSQSSNIRWADLSTTSDAANRFEQLRERIFRLKKQSNAL